MNLLDETKGAISQSEHSTDDVRFVGSRDEKLGIPWSQAEKVLDIDYDDGYGSQEIAADLVVVFTDGGPAPNASDVGTDTNPDVPKRRVAARVLLNKWLDKQMEVDDELA